MIQSRGRAEILNFFGMGSGDKNMLNLLYIILQEYVDIYFGQNCNSLDKHATLFLVMKGLEI